MASFFNKTIRNIDTSNVLAFTSSSDSTVVLSVLVANFEGTTTTDVTASLNDSVGALEAYIAYTIAVPADSNLDLLSNKLILPSGKQLNLLSSTSGTLDASISYVVL